MSQLEDGSDSNGPDEAASTSQRQPPSATQALENLHGLLVDAGQGNADPAELRAAIESFWDDHRNELMTAASTLTEQVRLQTLQELYKWRAQLATQTKQQPSSAPDTQSETTGTRE